MFVIANIMWGVPLLIEQVVNSLINIVGNKNLSLSFLFPCTSAIGTRLGRYLHEIIIIVPRALLKYIFIFFSTNTIPFEYGKYRY